MACTITFEIGKQKWEVTSEKLSPASNTISTEIIEALKDPTSIIKNVDGVISSWEEIKKALLTLARDSQITYRPTKITTLSKVKGLMANCNVAYLKTQYPLIDFPANTDNIPIFIADTNRIGSHMGYGKMIHQIIDKDGKAKLEDLFIIPDDEAYVQRLANYFKASELIKSIDAYVNPSSEEAVELNSIIEIYNKGKSKNKIRSISELLYRFLNNKSEFETLSINKDGKDQSVFTTLDNFMRDVMGYAQRSQFDDPFVNTVNATVTYYKRGDARVPFLDGKTFFRQCLISHNDEMNKLGLTKDSQYSDLFKLTAKDFKDNEYFKEIFKSQNYEDDINIAVLLFNTWVSEVEPLLPLSPIKFEYNRTLKKYGLFLKAVPITLEDYGFSFDTLSDCGTIVNTINGFKIYSIVNPETKEIKYTAYKHYLTEKAFTKLYDTQEEAEETARIKAEKEIFGKDSLLELKMRHRDSLGNFDSRLDKLSLSLRCKIPAGTVVDSLNIPIDGKLQFIGTERDLLFSKEATLKDFKQYILSKSFLSEYSTDQKINTIKDRILDEIDTVEKAAVFIYKINEFGDNAKRINHLDEILTLLDTIKDAESIQYYISSQDTITYEKGEENFGYHYKTKVIPTTAVDLSHNEKVPSYKKNKRAPILTQLYAIQEVFQNKLGVKVELLNANQVKEMFPGRSSMQDKSFIQDGIVYINSDIAKPEDALHEYTHLILGVLKTDPKHRNHYLELLDAVVSTPRGAELLQEKADSRPDIKSQVDLAEEVFADLFGSYMMRDFTAIGPEVASIFRAEEKYREYKNTKAEDGSIIKVLNNIFSIPEGESLSSLFGKSMEYAFGRLSTDIHDLLVNNENFSFTSTAKSRKLTNWIEEQLAKGELKEYDCV